MRVLVTAGNTQAPIDRVRCITNVFTGRTGTGIALHAHGRGHAVELLTSHPEVVSALHAGPPPAAERWTARPYRTFDDLQGLMEAALRPSGPDVVIHCAAVSDYGVGGVYAPAPGTRFDPDTGSWHGDDAGPSLVDRAAGKVKSDEAELWLRLVRAPKLIDRVRTDWAFRGVLVKFKLEVGIDDEALRQTAERSRRQSGADLMVANTLEGSRSWALLGPVGGQYVRVGRAGLAARLLDEVERLHRGQGDG
jgi:phosphopantothenoylcysteine synthetase/decarboxylase